MSGTGVVMSDTTTVSLYKYPPNIDNELLEDSNFEISELMDLVKVIYFVACLNPCHI